MKLDVTRKSEMSDRSGGDAHLGTLSWNEYESRAKQVPFWIATFGSVEQHGPHLPLETDSMIVERLASEVCSGDGALVVGSVKVGVLGKFRSWPGSVAVPDWVLVAQLDGMAAAIEHVNNRLLVLNGHDENHHALMIGARQIAAERGTDIVVVEWSELVTDVIRAISDSTSESHAGEAGTSLLMHWYPQRVRIDLLQAGTATEDRLTRDDIHAEVQAHHVAIVDRAEAPTGVIGDPTRATAAKGETIAAALIARVHALVRDHGWLTES